MKKYLMIALACILSALSMHAYEYNEDQKQFRNDLISMLQRNGITTNYNDTGDVYFTWKNKKYYMEVSDKNNNPFFVVFSCYYIYGKGGDTRDNIAANMSELNNYKGVKILLFDKNFRVGAEMFLKRASMLNITMLEKLFSQISSVENEIANLPTGVSSSSSSNTNYSNSSSRSFTFDNIFPICGYSIGDNIDKAKNNGIKVKEDDTYYYFYAIPTTTNFRFYDFNKDKMLDWISIVEFPKEWAGKFDIEFGSSYNDWLNHLRKFYSDINETEIAIKEFSGRKTLSATITVNWNNYTLIFYFEYGNKNGEGYSVNSINTLNQIVFKTKY